MFSHKLNRVNVSKNALHEWDMYNTQKGEEMVKYNIFLSKVVGIGIEQLRHSFADLYAEEIVKRKSDDAYALEYVGALDIIAAIVALGKKDGIKRSCFNVMIKDGEVVHTLERYPTNESGKICTWDEFIVMDYLCADDYRVACDVLLGGKECKDVKEDFLEFCDILGNQLCIEEMPGLTAAKTSVIPIREFLKHPERYVKNLTLFHEYAEGDKTYGK